MENLNGDLFGYNVQGLQIESDDSIERYIALLTLLLKLNLIKTNGKKWKFKNTKNSLLIFIKIEKNLIN